MNENENTGYEMLGMMLCTAFVAYNMGTTYKTAEKTLRRTGEKPSAYWIALAQTVSRDVVESQNADAAARKAHRNAHPAE